MNHYLYLSCLLGTILLPLVWSFEPNLYFIRYIRVVFSAIFSVCMFFIPMDVVYTQLGVWGFNPDYIVGIYVVNLPLEEVLFFILIPFACLFVYASVKYIFADKILSFKVSNRLQLVLATLVLFVGVINTDKYYTLFASVTSGLTLIGWALRYNGEELTKVWFSYLLICIPFVVVNGILTGYITSSPIVWYNSAHILNIRLGTIPMEDFFYNLSMFGMASFIFDNHT